MQKGFLEMLPIKLCLNREENILDRSGIFV
jgi:hypothetical protein